MKMKNKEISEILKYANLYSFKYLYIKYKNPIFPYLSILFAAK
jgi:hypothetical protein